MSTYGPAMHRQLMDAYKDAQDRLEEMRSDISSIDSKRDDLGQDRSDALVDLAEHYLPELTRDAIESSWTEVRDSIKQVLMRKEDRRRRVTSALGEANERRRSREDRLLELNQQLDKAKATESELAAKVKSDLADDDEFVSLSNQAAVAEAALERAEANLDEIEQDAARKLPAYESSSLFKYLRDQRFGTPEYEKRGFSRRMDRWVSRMIDYPKASQSYEFLVTTPDRMRELIAEDRSALDTVMDELESRRDLVVRRLGLSAAITKVEQLSDRRESQLIELDKLREETDSLDQSLTALEDTRGEYYREAVSIYREMLGKFDTADLASKARHTPSLTDDQIVARIEGVKDELNELDDKTRQHHDDIREMQRCIKALGRLMQRFRASKFDSSRSQFVPSFDVGEVLSRAKTERDIDEAWDRIRRAQRWGPTLSEQVGANPLAQILTGAMSSAAGSEMSEHADRAGKRREKSRRKRRSDWSEDGDSSDDYSSRKKRRKG